MSEIEEEEEDDGGGGGNDSISGDCGEDCARADG